MQECALTFLARHQGRALSPSDDGYPRRLLDLRSPPCVVFLVGGWNHEGPHVAVVGARNATDDGLDVARDLAAGLAREGVAVVSGLARGIDGAAHGAALDAGGLTGAVLGTGIDQVYPRSNAALQGRIARSLGLMSEVPPGSSPSAATFAARNRLLAAIAEVVVVVQGRATSGALITAREAARLGRPVAAIPWDSREPFGEAPHALIRAGATLVRDAADVLALLPSRSGRGRGGARMRHASWVGAERQPSERAPASRVHPRAATTDAPASDARSRSGPTLTGAEARLYRALRERPLPLDHLARAASLTVPELGSALLSLELQGLAGRVPGGLARKIRRR